MNHTRESLYELIGDDWGHLDVHRQRDCLSLDCMACEEGVDIGNPDHDSPEKFAADHRNCTMPEDCGPFAPWEIEAMDYEEVGR